MGSSIESSYSPRNVPPPKRKTTMQKFSIENETEDPTDCNLIMDLNLKDLYALCDVYDEHS